ncbi:MAG: DegT/DnrJ/EryC1/StrS family aminotransferase [Cytophagales bacterium]|nr:DegT/DnrJ/EryC1/StrS family aminotransferase [Cytophagales bacterium]
MIPVTKPFLPPENEYLAYIDRIWSSNWLTNNGPLVRELEGKLGDFLRTEPPVYVSNGTIALQLAIRSLNATGKIITTPFSYVATASSIVWEHCEPVFVDVDSETFNINARRISPVITDETVAILATHVFGNPCELDRIEEIGKEFNVSVIYDAAHAFGINHKDRSIFTYGDMSIASLHATKLYHSTEGGLLFSSDSERVKGFQLARNFGHDGPGKFSAVGINGKNSEFHAAMGLANLPYVPTIIEKRKLLVERYLENFNGLALDFQKWNELSTRNYAYMPVLFSSEEILLRVDKVLQNNDILGRRYFYPTLDLLPYVKQSTEIDEAKNISSRIFCLPLYNDLDLGIVDRICELVRKELSREV